MIAAALTAQSQAGAYVSAAGTEKASEQTEQTEDPDKESDGEETEQTDEDAEGFDSEESGEQETSGTPVILEDLSEEPVVYKLGEKAVPLKISVDCGGKPGYTWFQSVDNEHFEEILKKADTDPEKDPAQEETGKDKKQVEDGEEYTPSTEKAGTFYYKVKIRNTEDPDADQAESKVVCVQVLDENGEDENAGGTDEKADGDSATGSDAADGNGEDADSDASDGNAADTDSDTADSGNDEDAKDADSDSDRDASDADTDGDTSDTDGDATDGDTDEDTSDIDSDVTNADTDGDASDSDTDGDATDADTDEDTTDPDPDVDGDTTDSVPDSDTTLTITNHLPIRRSTIPETDTFETEGYWKADLSQIFEDPDGDELTYYEKDARAEDWEKLDSSDYLFHLTTAQETLLFTAKDGEGYGDVYAVTLKLKDPSKAAKNAGSEEDFSAGEALEGSAATTASFEKAYKTTGEYLAKMAAASTPTIGSTGGEWEILGLARSGQAVDSSVYSRYKSGIVNTVKSKKGILHEKKYTEYSRVVLALTSIGEDVTDVGGYNLLQPLSDFKQTVWQGVNGAIWALIAFDSKNYEVPKAEEGKTQNSREMLINHILEEEVKGGGWSIYGAADTDVTAMAIQALAPYYKTNSAVKAAVDRGLTILSNKQEADGGFGTWGTSTSESCAQVVVALSAMGIDANADKRFVKNGKSALQGLLNYAISTGGFKHVSNLGYDQMATEQGYYALTAYSRFKNGENSLYDMTDVPVQSDHEKAEEVIKAIDNLPETVTLDNMETVKTTYAAYNSLNTAQKTLISKARKDKLTKAMASIESLEIEKVEKLIAAIGTVTLDKEEAIRAAKVAYYSLSTAQQKKVKNFSTLEAAEKELNKLKYQASKPTPTPTPGAGKTPGGSTHFVATPTPTPKAAQTSKTTPTPKAAKTPAPTPTTTPSTAKNSGKSAGGATKSLSTGNSKSAASGKSSSKTDAKKSASSKNSKNAKSSSKTGTTSAKTAVKAEKTKASDSVLKKIKAFFKKDGSTYISKIKDFSDKEVNNILKVYKQYEKLSAGEKAAIQEDSVYKPYEELLKNLGTRNHFDQATGTQVSSEKDSAFPWYVQLKVNPELVTDKQMETIKKALGDQVEVFSLNEIHFVDTLNGDAWEPKDILNVELPMVDLGDYESCMIVHITDKGNVEFLNGKISGNIISFDAAEFSSYGIVGFMGSADDLLKEADKKQPVWPWAAGAGAALLLVVILGGVQLAGSRKAKAASGKKKDKSEK